MLFKKLVSRLNIARAMITLVSTALDIATSGRKVTVVADDTDVLVLLMYQ